jgi:hypothetical protein
MKSVCNILVDSGAFSAWRRGSEIPLQDYIEYCKNHAHESDAYVNLDCIPGENGLMDHSQSSIEKSAAKSYDNLQIMKAEGLSPIPVFHQGERFEWLDKMLADGESYVGISPYMRSHQSEIIQWMDRCFSRITDQNGRPYIKTHGFGVTACNLCTRFPWYSVDSTSWSVGGGYGSILVPQYVNGTADYSRPPLTLKLSARKQNQARGFDGLSTLQQDAVRQAAEDANVAMSELRNTFIGRWKFNVHYHLGMAKVCNGRLFKNRSHSLFAPAPLSKLKAYDPQPMKLYFATVLHTKHHNEFLNEFNIRNRLLSYAFLKDEKDDFLGEYIKTGLPVSKTPRPKKMSKKMLVSEQYRVRRAQSVMAKINREEQV